VISRYFGHALFVFALSSTPCLRAQDGLDNPVDQDESADPSPVLGQSATYSPLTLRQKYAYSFKQIFSGPRAVSLLTHAAYDSASRTSDGWGSGMDAFGVRLASRFGRSLLRQNIAFAVRALDHEDPRYFPSESHTPWKRAKDAIAQTFVVRNDSGKLMPAYSRFVADYGMPFIAQQWRPPGTRTIGEGFRSGSAALGGAVGLNVAQEFWPDLKKLIRTRSRLAARFIP
jgi:hypothetical protein